MASISFIVDPRFLFLVDDSSNPCQPDSFLGNLIGVLVGPRNSPWVQAILKEMDRRFFEEKKGLLAAYSSVKYPGKQ